ncbi:dynein heavy chain 5, axonemal-like isoform X4 [Pomacea canaliculata]|uniref:dynein heavy chain 5, axonemal-like isoform X4 n=1 Tax=Pomacea canaliculata TaxID=400727 RepID=UPI000D73ECCF|nr:dynein heavy chain 5, axonemal-like isoform X4 [Pomacea canaliculata]
MGIPIIQAYNRLSKVLVEYEVVLYRGWLTQVAGCKQALLSTLLVRQLESKKCKVNIDPQIFSILQETKYMTHMGLEIPPIARTLYLHKGKFKSVTEKLQKMLSNNEVVCSNILPTFMPLLKEEIRKVEKCLEKGLTIICWSSTQVDNFISGVTRACTDLEVFVNHINDENEHRIERVLQEMTMLNLCYIPSLDPCTVDEFLSKTEELCHKGGTALNAKSRMVEDSVHELLNMLLEKMKSSLVGGSGQPFEEKCSPGKSHEYSRKVEDFNQVAFEFLNLICAKNMDAVQRCIKNNLENIRKRLAESTVLQSDPSTYKAKSQPLFQTDIVLAVPEVIMHPSLEEVQAFLNKAVQSICCTSKRVAMWESGDKIPECEGSARVFAHHLSSQTTGEIIGQEEKRETHNSTVLRQRKFKVSTLSIPAESIGHSFFNSIANNNEIATLVYFIANSILFYRREVSETLHQFNRFSFIWEKNKEAELQEFMKEDRMLVDFRTVIEEYEKLEDTIMSLPEYYYVGPICLCSEKLKAGLLAKTKAWRIAYGNAAASKFGKIMREISEFIDRIYNQLCRTVKDLDDVHVAIAALKELREKEIFVDFNIEPIEETFAMLSKHELPVALADTELCYALPYMWARVREQSDKVQEYLLSVQETFKKTLIDNARHFAEACNDFYSNYDKVGPMVPGVPPQEASSQLIFFQHAFEQLYRQYVTYSEGEELFGLRVNQYPRLMLIKKELALLQKLYVLYNNVNNAVEGYYDIFWLDVDINKIETELNDFQTRCRRLPKGLKDWPAFEALQKKIDDFNEIAPLLGLMTNKALEVRHWAELERLTGASFNVKNDSFKLRNILQAPLLQNKEEIEDICISAVKEKEIESKLKQVREDWKNQDFQFGTFKNRGELLLKGEKIQEIVGLMEDSLMVLGSLMTNRYSKPFKKEIQTWLTKLSNTNEEAKRFINIDKSWIRIMQRAHETPSVITCCTEDDTLMNLLPHLMEQLDLCQKSLTGYLEKKRLAFPRFFFVSDPALLEILGQANDCHAIQAHLLSVFDNTKNVQFHDSHYEVIVAIISSEGEKITLQKPVKAEGNVEKWLNELMHSAQQSLHCIIRLAYLSVCDEDFKLLEFLASFPAQVGLLGIQIIWTKDATKALEEAKIDRKIMLFTNQMFLNLLNTLIEQTTKDLSRVERTKFETLITIHVHQRDIFDELVKKNVKSPTDFEWQKQSRFYFLEEEDLCIICITNTETIYQNEFLGCTDRLVITPLTDRCYITLAQALAMSMGGAPAGPAGTGKTETTKDMGRCLGKYVVVFNCSDQMDFRGLGRIFKGLAQSGSWGCFDEFNRIDLPVLSVAAQQIAIVLGCKKERKKQFIFTDGDVVDMNPEFGIFLTMNPGYAGRQELPENLKINFRTVAMMVPDRQIIMRVKLASVGFIDNILLAQKFYTLYKLCEEQLTKQVHYDFGLRNILSVLRTLGSVKRQSPSETELKIVMQVLRNMNLSKLVDQDEPLFLSLIDDLFPGMILDKAGYPALEASLQKNVEKENLVYHPPWILKIIQLFETQRVRHGLMTLGPSGAGKTCCIRMLMKALTDTQEPHREWRMNPKAITAPQMFGRLDVATNDWTDGIFSTLWRRTTRLKKGENVWIVLDGPVDAVWIENLNSVLDDNKTLTLANGDRIPMAPNSKILFEPHNIDNASPATVSRVGMVYMSSSGLHWNPILAGWLKQRPPVEGEVFMALFTMSFPAILQYAAQNLTYKMDVLESFLVTQATKILTGLIPFDNVKVDCVPLSKTHYEHLYIFAVMWSVGAFLELSDRFRLEDFIRGNPDFHLDLPEIPANSESTIFDYFVSKDGTWRHWNDKVVEYLYPKDTMPEYLSILVPNVDNVRTEFLINIIAKQEKAVLLIGEQGTAKTVMITKYTESLDRECHISQSINFSSATTPLLFQRTIESYIDKRVGNTYGPPAGKNMSVFIDDINMPVINVWGDQVANEIVRQLMENKGFYSLEKPGEFTNIIDVQILAAMIQPGGGRNDIPQRLKRQFVIYNCTLPSNTSIDKIFSVIGCGYFCEEWGFSKEVQDLVTQLVPLTRRLWQVTKIKMLPTPAKFHYVFNLRDLSRIWQGMLNVSSSVVTNEKVLISLWKHECFRVIADRFIDFEDIQWFEKTMIQVTKEDLGDGLVEFCEPNDYFVDFLRDAREPEGEEEVDAETPKIYESIGSFQILENRLLFYQQQYNQIIRGSALDLVFFTDAMIHLVKISRIIRTPKGHALLVGVGGSGKQSLSRLASFIAGYKSFQITLTRSYNINNLLDDLKYLYRTAGEGKGITFIFTDNEVKDESFLEYLNNMLSSGVVPNLFARDERDEILGNLAFLMKKTFPKQPPTQENLQEFFFFLTRQNLHVVLCFSPVGEKFRQRSLKFPGLISGCTIDWFQRWPKDALIAVADYFLSEFKIVASDKIRQEIIYTMGSTHDGVAQGCAEYFQRYRRTTHVTPKSYLSFLEGYKTVYSAKKKTIGALASNMKTGLQKLEEASQSIRLLSLELVEKEKELEVASFKAEEVLKVVASKAEAAQKVKRQVLKVKDKAQAIVEGINADKVVAEAKLEAARPALEEAEAALNTIKPADIATVRKLGKPPHLIMRIMDCVLILFRQRMDPVKVDPHKPQFLKPSWSSSLKLMSQGGFLATLMDFAKDTINDEVVELLEPYFSSDDYVLEQAKKVCGNVAGLLSWTKAMAGFFIINKEVLPLKANLAIQEARLTVAMTSLGKAQHILNAKENELALVQADFEKAISEKQVLISNAENCRNKMSTATTLINGLSGEKIRWTTQSKEFKEQIRRLVGDVLMCTGFLSYLGPFNQDFRLQLQKNWMKEMRHRDIPFTESLVIAEMLIEPTTVAEWTLEGLPSDELSTQNAIIVTQASRYPLLIDPQGQGKVWIKNHEEKNKMKVTSLNHKYFRNHLEDALSSGLPLLIEDIGEELDPALDNVLEKNFIKMGSSYKVQVGDKEVHLMKSFTLYITTKLPNPIYTPEISARTSVIDFTVTVKGLEDQLLGRVILKEKAELERERVELVEEVMANKKKMKELEDNLLFRLTSTKGSLVDDEDLINVLAITKTTAQHVHQKLEYAAETAEKISSTREEYRPVATRGSILYFLIVEMSFVNCMYQTSLYQFLEIFDQSLKNSQKSPATQKRISNIIDYMMFKVFNYAVQGLYEADKLTFTLLLALKIDLQSKKVKKEEFDVLIKGGAALDLKSAPPKTSKWITDLTWLNLVGLSGLHEFSGIISQISGNEKQWKQWFDKDAPEQEVIPDGYDVSLDIFRRLLLIRCWCPDRTLPQAKNYIADALGPTFAEGIVLNMENVWQESIPQTPLVGLLSMGSDPTNSIEALAKKHSLECRAISMGQGQEVHARKMMQLYMVSGGWLLLQNCHLSLDYVSEAMETILDAHHIHDSFRLWVTTEGTPKFPISFLQSSIKFTCEPPQGVKAGLLRTYGGITQEMLDYTNLPQWLPMLYGIGFLHTVVQERRKFGPLGWNIPYEFNTSDYNASVQFVQTHLDDMDIKKGVNWICVRYMLGEIQYGGRVTDDFDKRLLNTYCRVWFGEDLFKPTFNFYKGYIIPPARICQDYLLYINSLPASDKPEIFGLHSNADITYQTKTSEAVLTSILNIQPKDSGGMGGETRESVVYNMCTDMEGKLPPPYVSHEVVACLKRMGILQPMNIFLRQEIDRMNKVIKTVSATLKDLKLAIDGTIIMSENLTDALDSIYDARIPSIWLRMSWESSTLGFWFTELIDRNLQFCTWCFKGRPKIFWMTGFFNPQGFLTAMRQEVTRAHKGWALDNVILQNQVTKMMKDEVRTEPVEGVYVYGLYLEGAGWDRRYSKLVESRNKILSEIMPVIHIFANNTASSESSHYVCPIYKKPRRTDLTFVATVTLRSSQHSDRWILRGVALLCDIK